MDTLGALALATEPPNDDLLKKKAIGRRGNFISNIMWRNIIGQVIYQLIVLGLLQYKGQDILGLEPTEYEVKEQLNTMIFNAFVFCQVSPHINFL
jgi:Ca2+-transporting ATPase